MTGSTLVLQQLQPRIKNCEQVVSRFCLNDASYRNYDLQVVAQDKVLRAAEIELAYRMGARFPRTLVQELVNTRSSLINEALRRIPAATCILDSYKSIPWDALENLFKACTMPGLNEANITKILHKKRPRLIPILDSIVVKRYLEPLLFLSNLAIEEELGKKIVCHIKQLKQDADANREVLKRLSGSYQLSEVRILDIVIWTFLRRPKWWSTKAVYKSVKPQSRHAQVRPINQGLPIPRKALEAAKKHFGKKQPFSRLELYKITVQEYGKINPGSFMTADWSVNEISGYVFNSQKGQRHPYFFKRGDGLFELYDSVAHGAWKRVGNKCLRIN